MKKFLYILLFVSSYCIGQTNMYYPLIGMMSKKIDSLNINLVNSYNADFTATDTTGANNGTLHGSTTYTTGIIHQAFSFNGSTDYISVNTNSWNYTGDFSLSLWMYPTSLGNYTWMCNESFPPDHGWIFGMGAGAATFQIYGSSFVLLSATIAWTTNTWFNVVVVRKGGTGTLIYVNGVLLNSNSSTVDPIYNATQYSSIGVYRYDATHFLEYFPGRLDAINVWNKALTPTQVTSLYNSGIGKQAPF